MSEQLPAYDLAVEASQWDARELTPAGWADATDAAPLAKESVAISIRLPKRMVGVLKEFARRSGIGYQVLMKRWLDERIRLEHSRLKAAAAMRARAEAMNAFKQVQILAPVQYTQAASFDASAVAHPKMTVTNG